jgi:A/G-specific adenine glycosylase
VNPDLLRSRLAQWFEACGRDLPWRETDDPYAVLVSEFMLQQTQVGTVLPYFERWMRAFPDFTTLALASEAEVLAVWQGLGYYARARNLHRAAQRVVSEYGGSLPRSLEGVAQLPGVGPYTAGAVASFAFDLSAAAVDANIARVLARLYDVQLEVDSSGGSARIWELARELLPAGSARIHNSALMELGALICVPREPKCGECPVSELCQARVPGDLPRKKPRRTTVHIEENCIFDCDGETLLLEQQRGSRWKGLWKLPVLEGGGEAAPIWDSVYAFTHHKVHLRVFLRGKEGPGGSGERIALADLSRVAMAAAHARAVSSLLRLRQRKAGKRVRARAN